MALEKKDISPEEAKRIAQEIMGKSSVEESASSGGKVVLIVAVISGLSLLVDLS